MNLQDFILGLEDKIGALKDQVIGSVSVVTTGDDIFGIVRRAGILEGISTTKGELEKFLRGENDEEN